MSRTAVMTQGEEEIAFFYQIGRAIESWAQAENMLRHVVIACIPPGPDDITKHSVSVAFNSIDSFRAKVDFTEALVERRFPASQRVGWDKLVAKASSLSWQSKQDSSLANRLIYEENPPSRRLVLVPWVIPKPKKPTNKPPPGTFALKDIWKLDQEFIVLRRRLENFAAHLRGAKAPYPESELQPPHPPTTRS